MFLLLNSISNYQLPYDALTSRVFSSVFFFAPQFPKTVLTLTKLEKGKAVFIGSLMCSVTKQQLEGVG